MNAKISQNNKMLIGIFLAVSIWGVVHTVGAYLKEPARAPLVLICVGGFLGFWAIMLRGLVTRGRKETGSAPRWSIASLLSILFSLATVGLFIVTNMTSLITAPKELLIWTFAGIAAGGVAAVTAIVGISDPAQRRGKNLPLLTFAILAALIVAGFFTGDSESSLDTPTQQRSAQESDSEA